eukprot:10486203-Alexandrium_andersonii.AAC.1
MPEKAGRKTQPNAPHFPRNAWAGLASSLRPPQSVSKGSLTSDGIPSSDTRTRSAPQTDTPRANCDQVAEHVTDC